MPSRRARRLAPASPSCASVASRSARTSATSWRDGRRCAAARPFHSHEWLASLLCYLLVERLGHEQLLFAKGLIGLALFALAYRVARRVSGDFVVALVVALAAMALANYRHFLRPELFALLLTAIVLNLLVEYRHSGRWLYLIGCLPVAVIWANIHG